MPERKPAPKEVDDRLFAYTPVHIQELSRKARKELREAERKRFFANVRKSND